MMEELNKRDAGELAEIAQLKARCAEADAEAERAAAENGKLQSIGVGQSSEVERLIAEIAQLKARCAEAEGEAERAAVENGKLKARYNEATAELDRVAAVNAQLKAISANSQAELEKLAAEIARLKLAAEYVFKGDKDQEGGYDGEDLDYQAYNAGLSPSSRQCQ